MSSIIILLLQSDDRLKRKDFHRQGRSPLQVPKMFPVFYARKRSLLDGISSKLWISSASLPPSPQYGKCPYLREFSARRASLGRVPLKHKAELPRYILDYLRNERLLLPDNFQVWPSKYPFWISKYPPWLSKYPSWLSKYAYWLSKYPSFKVLFPAVTSPLSSDNVPSFIKRYQSNERICLKLTPLKV